MDKIYKNQSLIYKSILYIATSTLIVFFFPKGGKFKYDFQKGKPWQYENLYAPFDFSIKKDAAEIEAEKAQIKKTQTDFYSYNDSIVVAVKNEFSSKFAPAFEEENLSATQSRRLERTGNAILDVIYRNGILKKSDKASPKKQLQLLKGNEATLLNTNKLLTLQSASASITREIDKRKLNDFKDRYQQLFFDIIKPNVFYNENLSKKALEDELSKISVTRGMVDEGKSIIKKGEVVEA